MSSSRSNVLARLRRWRTGAARYVVAWFAAAYLAAGVAPCAAAAAAGGAAEHAHAQHVQHSHEHGTGSAGAHHGHDAAAMPPHGDGGADSCPHCSFAAGTTGAHADHSSCAALEDLTNAAPQAKSAPPALAPPLGAAAFTLPPPLASPLARPPWRSTPRSSIPLNVRHCVFLI
jgi:hypothetical protein